MAAKAVLLICAQVFLIQGIYSQCASIPGAALAAEELGLAGNILAGNALAGNILVGNALAGNILAGNGVVGNALAGNILAGNAISANGAYGAVPVATPVLANSYGFAPSSGGSFAVQSFSPIAPSGIRVASENYIDGAITVSGGLPFLGAVALDGVLPTSGAGGINYGCGNGAVGIVSENVNVAPASAGSAYSGLVYNGLGSGYGGAVGLPAGRGLPYGVGACGAI